MKKTLRILFSILSLSIMAQVPQGVGYQGVATDANGIELVNQSISIRASVLSGSANGTVEWEETHATSTDTFGLFTLTIGQGTNTTNGAQTSFADISWGTNTHFLKIEMDVTGGSNYSFMGTNQMMSVPYALFAESANINYDSISNLLSNDSTFITNVGGGMGGGGCDFNYPEGIYGEGITWDFTSSNSYTVPIGKSLYITNIYSITSDNTFRINGLGVRDGNTNNSSTFYATNDFNNMLSSPIIAGSGQIIIQENTGGPEGAFTGLLVDSDNIEIVTHCLCPVQCNLITGSSYTVPPGKKLYIINLYSGNQVGDFLIDGILIKSGRTNNDAANSIHQPIVVNSGMTVSSTSGSSQAVFNGYLVDENYFAGCGGGGGSSSATSSLDSTAIANMIAAAGGGCDYSFPEGIEGQTIAWDLGENNNQNDYTVPAGKNLFITNVYTNDGSSFRIDGIRVLDEIWGVSSQNQFVVGMLKLPLCVKAGQIISANTGGPNTFYGILTDATVEPISFWFDDPGTGFDAFTVPSGKRLVVTNLWMSGSSNDDFTIDGVIIASKRFNSVGGDGNKYLEIPLIINSGSVFSAPNNFASFNGYLTDENYFAGCGGGGSSTSSLDSTTIANMIAASGGGCDIEYPEGLDGVAVTEPISTSISYTVPSGKRLYISLLENSYPVINGKNLGSVILRGTKVILNAGDILSGNSGSTYYFNGYLADENYFAGCGGGSNSANSSFMVNQTILMANIPSFLSGDMLDTIIPNQSSYTVPTGKQLFVQFASTFPNPEPIIIDGQHISCSPTAGAGNGDWKKLIMDENETLSFGIYGSLNLHGSLVDKNSNENWITIVLDDVNNLSYTVPTGKNIFINSVVISCAWQGNYSGNLEGLEVGNILYQPGNSLSVLNGVTEFEKLTFSENTTITLLTNSNPSMVIIRALLY